LTAAQDHLHLTHHHPPIHTRLLWPLATQFPNVDLTVRGNVTGNVYIAPVSVHLQPSSALALTGFGFLCGGTGLMNLFKAIALRTSGKANNKQFAVLSLASLSAISTGIIAAANSARIGQWLGL
jgi:hypothetical protein